MNNGLYSRSHQVILTYYVVSFPSLESSYCTNSGMCDVYMMYKYDVISNSKIKKGKCQVGDAKNMIIQPLIDNCLYLWVKLSDYAKLNITGMRLLIQDKLCNTITSLSISI